MLTRRLRPVCAAVSRRRRVPGGLRRLQHASAADSPPEWRMQSPPSRRRARRRGGHPPRPRGCAPWRCSWCSRRGADAAVQGRPITGNKTARTTGTRHPPAPMRRVQLRFGAALRLLARATRSARTLSTWSYRTPLTGIDGLAASHAEAIAECAAHGWRLCTRAELAGVCIGTGCGMDNLLLWTLDGVLAASATPVAEPAAVSAVAAAAAAPPPRSPPPVSSASFLKIPDRRYAPVHVQQPVRGDRSCQQEGCTGLGPRTSKSRRWR